MKLNVKYGKKLLLGSSPEVMLPAPSKLLSALIAAERNQN